MTKRSNSSTRIVIFRFGAMKLGVLYNGLIFQQMVSTLLQDPLIIMFISLARTAVLHFGVMKREVRFHIIRLQFQLTEAVLL